MEAGVNGFRLNMSHGSYDERDRQIKWIRKASKDYDDKPVAIIADLQGPKIRLGDFEGFIPIKTGQQLIFEYGVEYKKDGPIPTQFDLSKKVARGERILLFDGRVKSIVDSIVGTKVYATAQNDGIITKRKGINLPDTDFKGDIITAKDKRDLAYAVNQDVDYIAMSFVQSADDIKRMRKLLKNYNSQARVIAKVETNVAVQNLDEIVKASDVVMVARGDLAMETEPESVPIVQRMIIKKCMDYGKISIVATQMLASMTEELEPTRAEVSDISTAVVEGADAVMLSDETASGKYPIEAISVMKRVILYTQTNLPFKPLLFNDKDDSIQSSISSAAITLASQVGAKAIVTATKSGATARSIAAHRPAMPIFMIASNKRVAQQLAIVYGGKSYQRAETKSATVKLTDFLRTQKVFHKDDIVVICMGVQPGKVGGTDTIKVRKLK